MKKRWVIGIGIILAIVFALFYMNKKVQTSDVLRYIPDNAIFVIKTAQPVGDWNDFSQSGVWEALAGADAFTELREDADYLDSLWKANTGIFKYLDNRDLVISAHFAPEDCYDYLFIVDLVRKGEQILVDGSLGKSLGQLGFNPVVRRVNGFDIISVKDSDSIPLYLLAHTDKLFCSYSVSIIEQVIDQKLSETGINSPNQYASLSSNDAQLYLNLSQLHGLQRCYLNEAFLDAETLKSIGEHIQLDLDFTDGETWNLSGTITTDSAASNVLLSVLRQPAQKSNVGHYLSQRTAWAATYTFESFETLIKTLESNMSAADKKKYDLLHTQGSAIMGEDFITSMDEWIGNDITACEIQTKHNFGSTSDYAVFVHASDVAKAQDQLGAVMVKMKSAGIGQARSIEYRNHIISYLGYNEFFKLILGGQFDELVTPHFTLLDDYVIFSNAASSLVGIIEDFEHGRTLDVQAAYQNYIDNQPKASVHAFIIPSSFAQAIRGQMTSSARADLDANSSIYTNIGLSGLHLSSHPKGAQINWYTSTTPNESGTEVRPTSVAVDSLYLEFAKAHDFESDAFVLQWYKDGYYVKYYPGSDQVHIRAKTDDNVLHGKYMEYFPSGKVKAEGKYKNGRKKGQWKYYKEDGSLLEKVSY